ncbi:ACP S-malonyltransferase [Gimesia panareensis]|uniref:Malonyl CoA-acyl carrier protein transacylase n=1 Tax=Gimesia panareensis TaxID=2527978 RepID=A0A518FNK3_9PLAN|nr:ACP S-malonyltransferase [Gimesia panareensis]QDT25961.1 Malonyl CoA-acyl carrier protein transacylase [Gimesia panareensis]QDU48898.1 Malonyl CoA-acyl carrier protein transacylase [Gimesia panareensis]QDV17936.1 Malonyl CoA-acyl carrier protein transacylase [Gimesia panareensis]
MSRIAFLFPGQGAQHVGMGKTIVEKYPAAKELFDRAAEILQYDLAKICFEGPSEELDSTVISQPALFVTSLAALEMLRADAPDKVLACEMTAGLSLGEYTALVFAGAMSFEDGLRVVQRRGEAMQAAADANPSGMVSVLLLDRDKVAEICEAASAAGKIWIANYLCPGNIVLSGENSACERAAELAEQEGGRAIPLAVAGAFHTEIMKPADSKLSEALAGVGLKKPEIPVISNVDAKIHEDPDEIRELLIRQVLSPVLWEDSIRTMLDDGFDEFYEIGPGKVLKGLMKRINRKISCETVNDS